MHIQKQSSSSPCNLEPAAFLSHRSSLDFSFEMELLLASNVTGSFEAQSADPVHVHRFSLKPDW